MSVRYDEVLRASKVIAVVAAMLVANSCGEQRATAPSPGNSPSQDRGPSLVECPTNQTTSTTGLLDLLGGSVNLGVTGITIPAGVLTVPTLFQVTVPASNYMEIDVSAVGFQSFLFQQPVTITIDYSRCNRNDINQETLHVYHIDPVTKQLLEDMGGVDDKLSRRITFTTSHLSGYAVAD
ncbi:MAG TPA: hypothetical protein VGH98_20980 [Gemmatimonadaceae bacterium]|jgi:hypothetical protein